MQSEEGVELTGDEKPKGFYAFFIYNYEEEAVQVFQFSQQGLIDPIISNLSDDEIQQEPSMYDFKLSTNGLSGMDKRYNVSCVPGKRRQEKVDKQIEAAFDEVMNQGADLSNLLVGASTLSRPWISDEEARLPAKLGSGTTGADPLSGVLVWKSNQRRTTTSADLQAARNLATSE